jgi:hypothetical protein
MYAETGPDGKRRHTVAEIGEVFGVSRKTIYRHLEPGEQRRQPDKSTRPGAPVTVPLERPDESEGGDQQVA